MVNFNATKSEMETIQKIVARAMPMLKRAKIKTEKHYRTELVMDLEACHSNGCPLDFERLLNADDFNFTHDVFGIRQHMNRETGQLRDLFVPRFAQRQHATV